MPQIAPIVIGPETYGAPRVLKDSSVLFIQPGVAGAIGDKKLKIGELAFSSTRPRRKATFRFEEPKVVVNAQGIPELLDTQTFEGVYEHGEAITLEEGMAFIAKIVDSLAPDGYVTQVTFNRAGQW